MHVDGTFSRARNAEPGNATFPSSYRISGAFLHTLVRRTRHASSLGSSDLTTERLRVITRHVRHSTGTGHGMKISCASFCCCIVRCASTPRTLQASNQSHPTPSHSCSFPFDSTRSAGTRYSFACTVARIAEQFLTAHIASPHFAETLASRPCSQQGDDQVIIAGSLYCRKVNRPETFIRRCFSEAMAVLTFGGTTSQMLCDMRNIDWRLPIPNQD